jgi:hypothetical protein
MTVRQYERLRTGMASLLISLNISGEKRGDVSGCKPQRRHAYALRDVLQLLRAQEKLIRLRLPMCLRALAHMHAPRTFQAQP